MALRWRGWALSAHGRQRAALVSRLFRGADWVPTATAEDVDLALKTFGVSRILISHTIAPTVTPMYDGKVIDGSCRLQPHGESKQDSGRSGSKRLQCTTTSWTPSGTRVGGQWPWEQVTDPHLVHR